MTPTLQPECNIVKLNVTVFYCLILSEHVFLKQNYECSLHLSSNSEKSGQMDHTVYQGNGKSVQSNWGQKL